MANRALLEELIDEENRWPPDRTNPIYEHLGAWWNNAPLVQKAFDGRIADVETMRRASQWLQYEGLRYAVEASLRRKECRAVLPWQFAESFPNAWCTAAVDWRAQPKPAYWGVARAYRDGHPTARFATCAWGARDEVRVEIQGDVVARLVTLEGAVAAESSQAIAALRDRLGDVFVLDLEGRNRYVMTTSTTLAPLLDLPQADIELAQSDGTVTLHNTGAVAALGLVVDAGPDAFLSDNVLDLLPGEERMLRVEGAGAKISVEGWNAAA
jgi:beta-mannosidase